MTVTLGEALRAGRTLRAPQPHPGAPVPCSPRGQEPCCAALALRTLCPFLGHTPDFLWVKCVDNACHLQSCFNPVCREVNRGSEGPCSHPAHIAQEVAEPRPAQGPHVLLLAQGSASSVATPISRWPLCTAATPGLDVEATNEGNRQYDSMPRPLSLDAFAQKKASCRPTVGSAHPSPEMDRNAGGDHAGLACAPR